MATDLRLWLRDQLKEIKDHLIEFLDVIAKRADADIEYIMPGYTHLQRGQPVRWSHWLLSYATAFCLDLERLREVTKRVNRSPCKAATDRDTLRILTFQTDAVP